MTTSSLTFDPNRSRILPMSASGPIRRTVTVANPPLGLHLRPANAIAKLVRRSKCTLTLTTGEKQADGRSPFDLILLSAMPGTELTVEVCGDQAAETLDAVAAILTAPGEADDHATSP